MKLKEAKNYKILWDLNPQEDPLNKETEIKTKEQFDELNNYTRKRKDTGYFYIDVWNLQARLNFFYIANKKGSGTSEVIDDFELTDDDIDHISINVSGWYPAKAKLLEKIKGYLK
ncbi:MAG: hypothetical protein H8D45_20285 [Bacteroidetes bacterium]|nr:hypothetical protein [Bacteroidota bacterium]MBC8488372.1 hypothetical protein [Bacteroidota bacterium]